jgi:hypothetical protein
MLRRALRLGPRVFRAANQVASRGFSTAHPSAQSQWPKRLLIASVVGGAYYLVQPKAAAMLYGLWIQAYMILVDMAAPGAA